MILLFFHLERIRSKIYIEGTIIRNMKRKTIHSTSLENRLTSLKVTVRSMTILRKQGLVIFDIIPAVDKSPDVLFNAERYLLPVWSGIYLTTGDIPDVPLLLYITARLKMSQ